MNPIAAPLLTRARSVAVAALAVIGFSACSGDSGGQEEGSATTAGTASETGTASEAGDVTEDATITIVDFAFGEPLTVAAGTTVMVVNDDGVAHTVTADDGSFDTGVVDAGTATELTLDAPGELAFFCSIHTSMSGSITVAG